MNKLLTILLIGLSSLNSFGQNIEFGDSKFKEKLLLLGIDTDGDYEISVEEAISINKIDIEGPYLEPPIVDLSGIEYFVNLDTFICVSHELRDVNLNKNKKLQYIDLAGNYGLDTLLIDSLITLKTLKITGIGYEIDSIKLSNFSELKELNIDYKSQLDVSDNANLEILSAYHIGNIDVTNNLKLKKLTCNNQTSIDLSNNIDLEYLSCIAYAYSDTAPKLNELNLSNNSNLKEIDCSQNNLTSLDLTNNKKLETFHGSNNPFGILDLTNNSKLQWFRCSNCDLDTLDLSMNNQLTYLHCHFNNISLLDLSNNPKLEYLYCSINRLDSLNVSNCFELKKIDCSSNQFEYLDFCSNSKLEWIQMVENPFLKKVRVWTLPFPPEDVLLNDWGSPEKEYLTCFVGLDNVKSSSVNIYPNPTLDILNIEIEEHYSIEHIKIISLTGQIVFYAKNNLTNPLKVDVSNFEKGFYIIEIKQQDSLITRKVLKI